ncbi:hypothetical protein QBC39DRAFT_333875 [Podospora conica]|nr:hypothetical protein QBC39DRAFT_333875 [Schizothecium conicum]
MVSWKVITCSELLQGFVHVVSDRVVEKPIDVDGVMTMNLASLMAVTTVINYHPLCESQRKRCAELEEKTRSEQSGESPEMNSSDEGDDMKSDVFVDNEFTPESKDAEERPESPLPSKSNKMSDIPSNKNKRPFTAKRVIIPGKVIRPAPSVVSVHEPTLDEIQNPSVYTDHSGCLGHLAYDSVTESYLMPYGFARGDEDAYGDMFQMNRALLLGEIEKEKMAAKCYSKLATKFGILRKQNNGTRPTNSFRLVASPSIAITFGTEKPHTVIDDGWVEVPRRVLDKARFIRMSDSSMYYMPKMIIGEVIVVGRCPSQGPDSTIPLRLCTLTTADFDGDEVWALPIFIDAYKTAVENNIPSWVDPAMLTTMTFDEMSEHQGGPMYENMLLKPKSSEEGMFNIAIGRHGLAIPYGYIRAGMMMGTVVDMYKNKISIGSTNVPQMPNPRVDINMKRTSCCLGLTKITRAVYQIGIDKQKHGSQNERIPAICTLLGDYDIALMEKMSEYSTLYSRLECIAAQDSHIPKLAKAYEITSMIEEIDSVFLTQPERLAVSYLFVYLSENVDSLMYNFSVNIYSLKNLGLDWYTSVTCSDIRWLKTVLRNEDQRGGVVIYTDTSTILGTIFLGDFNLSFPPYNIGKHPNYVVTKCLQAITSIYKEAGTKRRPSLEFYKFMQRDIAQYKADYLLVDRYDPTYNWLRKKNQLMHRLTTYA